MIAILCNQCLLSLYNRWSISFEADHNFWDTFLTDAITPSIPRGEFPGTRCRRCSGQAHLEQGKSCLKVSKSFQTSISSSFFITHWLSIDVGLNNYLNSFQIKKNHFFKIFRHFWIIFSSNLHAVWPDWAIFESSWQQIFLPK